MNLEEKHDYLLRFSMCESPLSSKKVNLIKHDNIIKLQNTCHSCCVYRYLSQMPKTTQNEEFETAINQIKDGPFQLRQTFSSVFLQVLHQWFLEIFLKPEESSKAINRYFSTHKLEINYFATVTFPSLYCHFVTDVYASKGGEIILNIINLPNSSQLAIKMCTAFLLSRPSFAQKICELFHTYESEDIYHSSSAEYFIYLINSIRDASPLLPKEFSSVLEKIFLKNNKLFIKIVYNYVLQIFKEDKRAKLKVEQLPHIKLLEHISESPYENFHIAMIASAFLNEKERFSLMTMSEYMSEYRSQYVFSCNELLEIQELMFASNDLLKSGTFKEKKTEKNSTFVPIVLEFTIFHATIDDLPRDTIFNTRSPEQIEDDQKMMRVYRNMQKIAADNSLMATDLLKPNNNLIDKAVFEKIHNDNKFKKFCIANEINAINSSIDSIEKITCSLFAIKNMKKLCSYFFSQLQGVLSILSERLVPIHPRFTKRETSFTNNEVIERHLLKMPAIQTNDFDFAAYANVLTTQSFNDQGKRLFDSTNLYNRKKSACTTKKNILDGEEIQVKARKDYHRRSSIDSATIRYFAMKNANDEINRITNADMQPLIIYALLDSRPLDKKVLPIEDRFFALLNVKKSMENMVEYDFSGLEKYIDNVYKIIASASDMKPSTVIRLLGDIGYYFFTIRNTFPSSMSEDEKVSAIYNIFKKVFLDVCTREIFDAYMLLECLLIGVPDFRTFVSKSVIKGMQMIEGLFYSLIKELDPELNELILVTSASSFN